MAKTSTKLIANNKKAYHDYFILDTYEAGIALHGTEVKSLRMGKCSVKESFIRVENGEVFIYGMHISPYEKGKEKNMVPTTKEALRKLVTDTTIEIYEDLTPQLIQMIDQTKHDEKLTEAQKQDEISLHLLGYVKSCTNEIIVDVLAEILGLE